MAWCSGVSSRRDAYTIKSAWNLHVVVELLELFMELLIRSADLYDCSSAIVAYGKKSKWLSSLALLERMPQERLLPNAVVYNSAVSACSSAPWARVAKLLSCAESRDERQHLIATNSAASTYSRTNRRGRKSPKRRDRGAVQGQSMTVLYETCLG
eukprot:s3657_g1.t1